MNTSLSSGPFEAWWKTYAKAIVFVVPAVSALAFSATFLLPKLEEIWRESGFNEPSVRSAVGWMAFTLQNGFLIVGVLALILGLLEWKSNLWPRYRRACVGAATWIVNTAVLVFITALFTTALMAAPALMLPR